MSATTLQPPGPITVNPSAVYTSYAVAWLLGVTLTTVLAAVRRGELPAVRRGRQTYITGHALLAWLSPTNAISEAYLARAAKVTSVGTLRDDDYSPSPRRAPR